MRTPLAIVPLGLSHLARLHQHEMYDQPSNPANASGTPSTTRAGLLPRGAPPSTAVSLRAVRSLPRCLPGSCPPSASPPPSPTPRICALHPLETQRPTTPERLPVTRYCTRPARCTRVPRRLRDHGLRCLVRRTSVARLVSSPPSSAGPNLVGQPRVLLAIAFAAAGLRPCYRISRFLFLFLFCYHFLFSTCRSQMINPYSALHLVLV